MTILAIIMVIIIATCIVFWYRRRTRRIMENLNRMLDIAIQGDFTEEHFDESMLSSVENKLANYLAASTISAKNVQAEKDKIKTNILVLLNEKYGMTEEDFLTAELTAVPAFKAKDVGLDRVFVGAYGHDDRVCGYTALTAMIENKNSEHTLVCVLADKEETGSEGNTGLNSAFLKYIFMDLAANEGVDGYKVMRASKCLSADVSAAYDPNFADVFEKHTSSCRLVRTKTTNMGSLYKLHYRVEMKDAKQGQAFIDELRCRNGNLEITVSKQETTVTEL